MSVVFLRLGVLATLLAALVAVPLSSPASAQEDGAEPPRKPEGDGAEKSPDPEKETMPRLEERVVVSATLAEERWDPVPFTDLSRADIETRDRGQDLGMLLADSPNAYAYSDAGNGVGYSYLSLRGFDQRRIAVLINGVPLNTPETHQVYFIDLAGFAGALDRIQIQRGPGTALYGSPAVGGVVNLETRHLDRSPGGEVRIGAGSFGTWRADLRYGGALGRDWAWSVRAAHVASEGYRDPSWTRHSSLQLSLERFGANSALRIHLFGGPEETQLAYLGVPRLWLAGGLTGDADRDRRRNPLRRGETDTFFQPHLQVLHDWRVAPGVFLKNAFYAIAGQGHFRQYAGTAAYDAEALGTARPGVSGFLLDASWQRRALDQFQVGWIPKVSWDHRRGTLVAGLELMRYSGRHLGSVISGLVCLPPDLQGPCGRVAPLPSRLPLYDYRNDKTTWSAFARETIRATDTLSVHLELQATRHVLTMSDDRSRGYSFDATYDFLTPRAGINWNITKEWSAYASVSTARSEPAFRDIWNPEDPYADPRGAFGDVDPRGLGFGNPKARPERLLSYELGGAFRRGTSYVKLNAYRMEFEDELVFAGGIDNDGLPITANAGRSTHQGLEIEGGGTLPGRVDVQGHAAWSRDILNDYRLVLGPNPTDVVDSSGNRIALFPDHMMRVQVSRAFGPVRLSLGARRVGRIYLDNSENERKNPRARLAPGYVDKEIAPFTLWDLRGTLDLRSLRRDAGALSIDLQVDNLFDRRFEAFGYVADQAQFIPGASRSLFLTLTAGL